MSPSGASGLTQRLAVAGWTLTPAEILVRVVK